jgi:hypothetical protein
LIDNYCNLSGKNIDGIDCSEREREKGGEGVDSIRKTEGGFRPQQQFTLLISPYCSYSFFIILMP